MKILLSKASSLLKPLVASVIQGIRFIIYLIIGLFAVVVFFAAPFSKLADIKFDTLPITNYCFAIMGGCASICFSWSRNVDQNNKRLVNQISFCGERSFLAAVCFVIASALKFFVINKTEYFNKASPYILVGIQLFSMVAFVISLVIGLSSLYYILKLLSKHVTDDQKFDEL
jgi:hypothetical protein